MADLKTVAAFVEGGEMADLKTVAAFVEGGEMADLSEVGYRLTAENLVPGRNEFLNLQKNKETLLSLIAVRM